MTIGTGLSYHLQGPGDYFFSVRLFTDSRFHLERGGFRSVPPRIGSLDVARRDTLVRLLVDLAPLSSWSHASIEEAFETVLVVGEGPGSRTFRWSGRPHGLPRALAGLAGLLQGL